MAHWKKGRGKLGVLDPLLGTWVACADSPMGPIRCSRTFERVLGGNYVQLRAVWKMGEKGSYVEHALFGPGEDADLLFWSFTNDGKRSQGHLANVTDIHPEAVGFEAQMPAGLARQAYWPDGDGGVFWVVESKNKKGWHRFTEHRYKAEDAGTGNG